MQLHLLAWGNTTDQQKIDSAIQIIKEHGYNRNIAILQVANYTHKPIPSTSLCKPPEIVVE